MSVIGRDSQTPQVGDSVQIVVPASMAFVGRVVSVDDEGVSAIIISPVILAKKFAGKGMPPRWVTVAVTDEDVDHE